VGRASPDQECLQISKSQIIEEIASSIEVSCQIRAENGREWSKVEESLFSKSGEKANIVFK